MTSRKDEFNLNDAMLILTETYHKILKINLTTDTHIDIKMYDTERDEMYGYSAKISEWLRNFAESGQIYEKDVEQYLRFTDTRRISEHFKHSNECLRLRYRRRTNNVFRWVMMELLKASDYTDDNRTIMLYIRDIHDSYIRELEEQKELEYLCNFDTMTGLKNLYSYRSLCNMLSSADAEHKIGVMFADLNGLKVINDLRGHEKGNEYICAFAGKLREHFGKYECCRFSGDEFLVVAVGEDEEKFVKSAEDFDALIKRDAVPTASIGYSWKMSRDIESVTADAESRMYEEKQAFYNKHPEYKHSAVEKNYHNEMNVLIHVLTDSYEVLLTADLNMDTYNIIKQNITSIKAGEPETGVYSERNDSFCNNYVSDDFRELRRGVGSIANLKEQLRRESHIICDYRLKNGQWRESAFWKMDSDLSGEPTKIIYYSQSIDRSMTERLSYRMKTEEEYGIMAGLSEVYRSISVIDLETERIHLYQNISLPDHVAEFLSDAPYDEAMRSFAEEFITEEDAGKFLEQTRLNTVRKSLKSKRAVSFFCRIKPDKKEIIGSDCEKFSFCLSNNDNKTVILATKDITDIVEWSKNN